MAVLALMLGCERPPGDQRDIDQLDIVGTWEVVAEGEAPYMDDAPRPGFTAERHRYIFAPDSTLRIFRPRPLGPASSIFAVYDFRGDTLVIRSDFDAGYYVPEISNDTLYLNPIDAGRPLTLARVDEEAMPVEPPPVAPPAEDGVYSPPSDLPPEEMPQN